MAYRSLADAVVLLHLGYLLFVPLGPFLARRWRRVLPVHLAALAWGAWSVLVGLDCPLTALELRLRALGGEAPYPGGFVDRYLEDVVYPGALTPYLWAVALGLVVVAYAERPAAGTLARWRSRRAR